MSYSTVTKLSHSLATTSGETAAEKMIKNEDVTVKTQQRSKDKTIDKFFLLEVVVMTPVVLITIGVFLIPFVLFALPPTNQPPPSNVSEVSKDLHCSPSITVQKLLH